jgi:Tfp pilus assembly protein PilN
LYFQASVGIYIENNRVSLACLKRSFKGLGMAAHATYSLFMEDPAEKTMEIRNHVNGFLGEHRIASADIFLGIPRDLTILKFIELPMAVKENLKGTLGYEIEKYVPLPAGDIYFDCQIISEDREANKLNVLLIAVKKELIDPYMDRENPLGAGISGIEINSTALANYFACHPDTPDVNAYAIVYLEGEHLELSLINKRVLVYSRHVKIDQKRDDIRSIVREELELLRRTVAPERDRLEVVICGHDSAGIAEWINDMEEIHFQPEKMARADMPSDRLALTFGLALKGLRKTPMDINLLPAGLRKRVSKAGYYTMFILAGLLILSVLAWGGSHVLHQKHVSGKLSGEIKKLSAEIAAIQQTQESIRALEDKIDALNGLRRRHVPVLGILLDMSKGMPEGSWLDRLSFNEKTGDMEGYADSASSLIPLLAASALLNDVAFLSPITKGKDGKERFRIGFKVR